VAIVHAWQPRQEPQQLLLRDLLHAELKFAHLVKEHTEASIYEFYTRHADRR